MATLTLHDDPLPLSVDEAGRIRIAGSRVFLPIFVAAYEQYPSADELARQFDSLDPADVYATLAYYLRHREEIDAYCRQVDVEADALWEKCRAERPEVFVTLDEWKARIAARQQVPTS